MELDKCKKQNKITGKGRYLQTRMQLALNQNIVNTIGELNHKQELNEQHKLNEIELDESIPLRYGEGV